MNTARRLFSTALLATTLVLAGCQMAPLKQSSTSNQHLVNVGLYLAQSEPGKDLIEGRLPGGTVYLTDHPVLTRRDITDAAALRDGQGRYFVGLRFTALGSQRLNEISMRHVGKPLAVVIDGRLVAAPRIAEPLNRGALSFSVDSQETAEDIAAAIRGD